MSEAVDMDMLLHDMVYTYASELLDEGTMPYPHTALGVAWGRISDLMKLLLDDMDKEFLDGTMYTRFEESRGRSDDCDTL